MIMVGLVKNKKYDFNISGYYTKNNQLNYAYHHNILELTPTKSVNFKKSNFANKLKGKILLQIESRGEAWYINPKDEKRYYMANGNEAYNLMRNLGIGITNKDLDKIKSSKILAKKSSGKIFLQVENKGEAYYIDFSGNLHYLKNGSEAYGVMRNLGLGITDKDLEKIPKALPHNNVLTDEEKQVDSTSLTESDTDGDGLTDYE